MDKMERDFMRVMRGWESSPMTAQTLAIESGLRRVFNAQIVPVPIGSHPGGYEAKRPHPLNNGVNLYAPSGAIVNAMTGGVVSIVPWTGPHAKTKTKAWNDTWAVVVRAANNMAVVYGGIEPDAALKNGQDIQAGAVIGTVIPTYKAPLNDGRPTSFLHVKVRKPVVGEFDLAKDVRIADRWTNPSPAILKHAVRLGGSQTPPPGLDSL